MRDENEIQLKRSYWQGVSDALKSPDKSRPDRLDKDKITSDVWLAALDWILGQNEESATLLPNTEENKR